MEVTKLHETNIVWDRTTGRPYTNAIVLQDTRTAGIAAELENSAAGDLIRQRSGLTPASYFAGGKLAWILRNVDGVRAAAEAGNAVLGTADTWGLWWFTGGQHGGIHGTGGTDASGTMLMDLQTLDGDDELLDV